MSIPVEFGSQIIETRFSSPSFALIHNIWDFAFRINGSKITTSYTLVQNPLVRGRGFVRYIVCFFLFLFIFTWTLSSLFWRGRRELGFFFFYFGTQKFFVTSLIVNFFLLIHFFLQCRTRSVLKGNSFFSSLMLTLVINDQHIRKSFSLYSLTISLTRVASVVETSSESSNNLSNNS